MEWLVGHLVGDFLLQNRSMALRKYTEFWVCFIHCTIYTIVIALFTGWSWWMLALVWATHWIIDRYQLGIHWRRWFSHDTETPWAIMADQSMHFWVLYILAQLA